MGLVEVYGLGDIVWNHLVVLPGLGDTVNLYGQENGNSHASEISRQRDCGRCAPAVAEQNDSCLRFFQITQDAIMIAVEQPKDRLVCGLPVPVLEDLYRGTAR